METTNISENNKFKLLSKIEAVNEKLLLHKKNKIQ